jgi:phosphoglycolate phosphatase
MKHKLKAVIFDFDGVIIDSGADIANAVNHTLIAFGLPALERDKIISYVGHGAEVLVRKCFQNCSEEVIQKALPTYKTYYLENALIDTRLYPYVEEILAVIKEQLGCRVALVTNKPENIARRILTGLNINKYFDAVLGPESVNKMKPDPEGILKVLAAFETSPDQAIMVGDSHTDIEAGKKAGTHTCGVTYGFGDNNELIHSDPEFLIDDITQLLDHIQ